MKKHTIKNGMGTTLILLALSLISPDSQALTVKPSTNSPTDAVCSLLESKAEELEWQMNYYDGLESYTQAYYLCEELVETLTRGIKKCPNSDYFSAYDQYDINSLDTDCRVLLYLAAADGAPA